MLKGISSQSMREQGTVGSNSPYIALIKQNSGRRTVFQDSIMDPDLFVSDPDPTFPLVSDLDPVSNLT